MMRTSAMRTLNTVAPPTCEMRPRSARDRPEIALRTARDMSEICPRYARDMPEIWPRSRTSYHGRSIKPSVPCSLVHKKDSEHAYALATWKLRWKPR